MHEIPKKFPRSTILSHLLGECSSTHLLLKLLSLILIITNTVLDV